MKSYLKTISLCGCLALAVGCGKKSEPVTPANGQGGEAASEGGHSHGSGPHGGAVADWGGGDYHVEFTVDHDKKQATVYVLGNDGKTAAPIEASEVLLSINEPAFQVKLAAEPQESESGGASSRFVGQHENLGIVQEFAGSISGEFGGTPYVGEFAEVAGEN